MGSPRRDGAGAARRAPRRFGDESGLTLIEMMVAFSLLAVMLAATAGTLIVFTRTAAENERRVQATAILNEVQEEMHAAPWEVLGVYENELEPLDEMGAYVEGLAGVPGTLDGEELVQLPSWDDGLCAWSSFDEALACGRDRGTPRTEASVDRDGRSYTVQNAVTWVDRSGDGIGDVKRLISVARWSLLGRTYEERFVSERAPTNIEAGDPQRPRLIQLDLAPRVHVLGADERLQADIEVRARFTLSVESAEIRFHVVDDVVWNTEDPSYVEDPANPQDPYITDILLREEVIELTGVIEDAANPGKYVSFEGRIPTSSGFVFTDGPRKIRAVGIEGEEEFEGVRTLELQGELPHEPDPGDDPPEEPVDESGGDTSALTIDTAPGPTQSLITLSKEQGVHRNFCQDLTIAVTVSGLNPEDTSSVTISYSVGSDQVANRPLVPLAAITGTNDHFSYTFAAGEDHDFRAGHVTGFRVHVERISGGEVSHLGDELVTFADAPASGCA